MSHWSYFLFYFMLFYYFLSDPTTFQRSYAEIFFWSRRHLKQNPNRCWRVCVRACVACVECVRFSGLKFSPNWWNIHLMCVCGAVWHLLDISECHKLISIIRNAHLTRFASSHLIFGRCFYRRLHSTYINKWAENELEFSLLFILCLNR